MSTNPKIALTIAGNDASGGAGIAADLKTFTEYGVFGISTLTCIATMDPNDWKHTVFPVDFEVFTHQLDTALSNDDGLAAFKTGMISTIEQVDYITKVIKENDLQNFVFDPVMVCKGEDDVLNPELSEAMRQKLLPLATVVTPNLFEAGQLAGLNTPDSVDGMKEAAKSIYSKGAKNVVIKGGTGIEGNQAVDIFYNGDDYTILEAEKITDGANHGAGCTFAAAVTAGLANGLEPLEAVTKAKEFVSVAIRYGFKYNKHCSPVYHSAHRLNN